MPGITTRISAFFGNSNANLDMSRFYSAKKEFNKADKYCRRAESIIAKDLKKARNSSINCSIFKDSISKACKLYDLKERAAYTRKYLDSRLKTIIPSGIDHNKVIVKTHSSSVTGETDQATVEAVNKMQIKCMEDSLKSSEHINHLKGNLLKLCADIVNTKSVEPEQVRRVVTCMAGLKHLDPTPAIEPAVDSYTTLLAEKIDGITLKDLGNRDDFPQEQKQALIDFMPRIKNHVESSS